MISRIAYAVAGLILFIAEVCIALFVNDAIIRPYIGDVLAIALVYCILRASTPLKTRGAIIVTLLIATAIEVAQAMNLLDALGLRDNAVIRTVLGGSFDPMDFVAYGAGALLVAIVEAVRPRR